MLIKNDTTYQSIKLEQLFQRYKTEVIATQRNKFHGGDVAACARKAVLHTQSPTKRVAEKQTAESAFYFSIGNAAHDTVQKILKDSGILVASEVSVFSNLLGPPALEPLHGYIDNVIKVGKSLALVEVKTCGNIPAGPKFWHKRQLNAYMFMTGITQGFLVYVSRNVVSAGKLAVRVFSVTDGVREAATEAATAAVYHEAKLLPAKNFLSEADCGFCSFRSFCWGESLKKSTLPEASDEMEAILDEKILALVDTLIAQMPEMAERFTKALS